MRNAAKQPTEDPLVDGAKLQTSNENDGTKNEPPQQQVVNLPIVAKKPKTDEEGFVLPDISPWDEKDLEAGSSGMDCWIAMSNIDRKKCKSIHSLFFFHRTN